MKRRKWASTELRDVNTLVLVGYLTYVVWATCDNYIR